MSPPVRRASRPLLALVVSSALVLAGCGTSDDDDGAVASGPSRPSTASDSGHEDHGGAHPEEPATSPSDLAPVLLRLQDLPRGYVVGHAHGAAPTGEEPTPAGCRPLAELLRPSGAAGHAGHAGEGGATTHGSHEAAAVAFTRSHVGPTVSQTVVDVGAAEPAAAEVRRVEVAATACREYVHSTSRSGANRYSVAPLAARDDAPPGSYVRLTATDEDFTGAEAIHWDLWVHDCTGVLVAVSFRSVPGGDDADFWTVVSTAADRLHSARSPAC